MSEETKKLMVVMLGFASLFLAIGWGAGQEAKYKSAVKIKQIELKIEQCKQDKKWCQ